MTHIFANSFCIRLPSMERICSMHEFTDCLNLNVAVRAAAPRNWFIDLYHDHEKRVTKHSF